MDHARIIALDATEKLLANSGVGSRIELVTTSSIPDDALRALPAVLAVDRDGPAASLTTSDPQPTLNALFSLERAGTLTMRNLNVRRPTLEDVFLKLTGHTLRD
jgi:ABC-2 type transport system ATP-binding protein